MTYNPEKDAPRNEGQLSVCVDHYEAIEQRKAQADPAYQPKTREDLKHLFSVFLQPEPAPVPEPTADQLFYQLRSIREVKLREYDTKVSQLERRGRLGENVGAELAAWDAYALALCNLPEQDGAPWDGGGSQTPWPVMP